MQHQLISPAPTVLVDPILKLNWSLILYIKALIKLSKPHAVLPTESPSSRLGCPLPPHPRARGKPGGSHRTRTAPANKGLALPCAASR